MRNKREKEATGKTEKYDIMLDFLSIPLRFRWKLFIRFVFFSLDEELIYFNESVREEAMANCKMNRFSPKFQVAPDQGATKPIARRRRDRGK